LRAYKGEGAAMWSKICYLICEGSKRVAETIIKGTLAI